MSERHYSIVARNTTGHVELIDSGDAQRTLPALALDNQTLVATIGALEGQLAKSPTLVAGLLQGGSSIDYGAVGVRLVGPAQSGTVSMCAPPTINDSPAPLLIQFERSSADGRSNTTAAFDARTGQLRLVLEHQGDLSLC